MAFLESQKLTYLGLVEGQKLKSFSTETTCRQLAGKKTGESRHKWNTEETVRVNLPMSLFVSSHICATRVSVHPLMLQQQQQDPSHPSPKAWVPVGAVGATHLQPAACRAASLLLHSRYAGQGIPVKNNSEL